MTFRPPSLSYFSQPTQSAGVTSGTTSGTTRDTTRGTTPGTTRGKIRGQHFTVHRFAGAADKPQTIISSDETLFIFAETGGELVTAGRVRQIPPRAFVIASPGKIDIRPDGPGCVYALTTGAIQEPDDIVINAADYRSPDQRVKPLGSSPALARATDQREDQRVYMIDDMPFPAENSRLKFLRTDTMSVNWVEYDGPRNRAKLSPHAHTDFEQGSLAISGNFIHHIRAPWTADANQWQEDRHIDATADSVLIIPPELIHTTEGVGEGRHILIDIFAPPREDFIAKGWVHNAAEYLA